MAPTTSARERIDRPSAQDLWRRWVAANALGELVGLGLTGAVAAGAMLSIGARRPVMAAGAVVASGAIEGAVVGYAQWRVLSDRIALPARRWIVATVIGAVAAWAAGVTPSLLFAEQGGAASEPAIAVQLLWAALLGLIAGPVLAGPQALALRGHVDRPWRWIAANAAAWACALPVTFLAPALLPAGAPAALVALGFAVGALAAGAVAGAVHGVTLVRLADGRATAAVVIDGRGRS